MSPFWVALGREVIVSAVCGMGELPVNSPIIQQTYHFDSGTVIVTPLHAEASSREQLTTREQASVSVIPASFTQNPAPPLPTDDLGLDVPLTPEPPAPLEFPAPPQPSEKSTAEPALISPCPAAAPGLAELSPSEITRRYQEIYSGIPFSRAEYDANPTYRHDTTVELLFGLMRPTVIQRSQTRVDVQLPPVAVSPWAYNPYGMNSLYYPFYRHGVRVYRGR